MSKGLVCVTGAAGFIGTHVVRALVEAGFSVRATVRDAKDEKKTAHLRRIGDIALVSADLNAESAFDAALEGCDYLIHTASPVLLTAKDPMREIVEVAERGTLNVLRAAHASRTIKRVVQTSSVSAVVDETKSPDYLHSETDWNQSVTVKSDPYALSKVRAERAAHAFVGSLPKDERFEVVSILPSLVLGPVETSAQLSSSPAILFELMRGAWPGVPDLWFGVVDVRDVAESHVLALTADNPTKRYVCSGHAASLRDMAKTLRAACPEAKVPSMKLPSVFMYLTALFDPRLTFGFLKQNLGRAPKLQTKRIEADLGITWRPLDTTIKDTGRSIVDGGFLPTK